MGYASLAGFYFCYFALLGVMLPYFNLYLDALGLDARQIGLVSSMMLVTRIFAPWLWGWLADRSGRPLRLIRLGCVFAALCFSAIFLRQDYAWLLAVMTLFTVFWNAVLPQVENLTLARLGEDSVRYGRVRLWGSVSFILAVSAAGVVLDRVSVQVVPWLMLAALLASCAGTLVLPQPAPSAPVEEGSLWAILRRPLVLAFFACCVLMLLSHGPYYTFFSLYLQDHGYSRTLTGQLWSLSVVAEILLFLAVHRLLQGLGLRRVILLSLLAASLRWLLTAFFVDSLALLLLAQCLHAATYGAFHAAGILLVRNCFGQRHRGQGQALFSTMCFGVGGALGAWLSGLIWQRYPQESFVAAAACTALAWLIAWLWVRGPETLVLSSSVPRPAR